MGKMIHPEFPCHVAPRMLGEVEDEKPIVTDELTNTKLDPYNIDHKILIYEREVKGWFLNPAKALLHDNDIVDNAFIVLMVATSYIEGVQQLIRGEDSDNGSRRAFIDGMKRIFSISDETNLNLFYEQLRCGLFHDGMTRGLVVLDTAYDDPIDFFEEENVIGINHQKFLQKVIEDFDSYINNLKNKNNLTMRNNFNRLYKIVPPDYEKN